MSITDISPYANQYFPPVDIIFSEQSTLFLSTTNPLVIPDHLSYISPSRMMYLVLKCQTIQKSSDSTCLYHPLQLS